MYTIKSSGMFTRPRWYFNLMTTLAQRLGMLDHITTTTTVYLKSKRQNVSISYMRLKEIHSLALALFLVHVLIESSSLCHVFAYTNLGVFLFGLFFCCFLTFQLEFPILYLPDFQQSKFYVQKFWISLWKMHLWLWSLKILWSGDDNQKDSFTGITRYTRWLFTVTCIYLSQKVNPSTWVGRWILKSI